jgi:hypothetical protein
MEQIEGTREETVEATKNLKLDTTLQSPDGYELAYDGYSHSGLLNDVFLGRRVLARAAAQERFVERQAVFRRWQQLFLVRQR